MARGGGQGMKMRGGVGSCRGGRWCDGYHRGPRTSRRARLFGGQFSFLVFDLRGHSMEKLVWLKKKKLLMVRNDGISVPDEQVE